MTDNKELFLIFQMAFEWMNFLIRSGRSSEKTWVWSAKFKDFLHLGLPGLWVSSQSFSLFLFQSRPGLIDANRLIRYPSMRCPQMNGTLSRSHSNRIFLNGALIVLYCCFKICEINVVLVCFAVNIYQISY